MYKYCYFFFYKKSYFFIKVGYLYNMGRTKKTEEEKKIKISITLDRILYKQIKEDKIIPSRIIESLIRKYYEDKDL